MTRPSPSGKDSLDPQTLWDAASAAVPGTPGEPESETPSGSPPSEDADGAEPESEPEPESRGRTSLSSAAEIIPTSVNWLWRNRFPLGKVAVLDGRPGVGKSSMMLDLAARVTLGREMPDGFDPEMGPRNVIFITAEDDWESTVVPRLMAAGADLTRVYRLDDLVIPDGVLGLEKLILEVDAALVVIDPLVAFVPAKLNLYRDQDSRLALKPLAEVATRTGAVIVGLRHINKSQGGPAQDRGTGSVAIGGAARSNLIAGPDPDKKGHFVLASIKNNVGPKPPSLGYSLETVVVDVPGGRAEVAVVRWEGAVGIDADDLVSGEKQGEAVTFLKGELAEGPKSSNDLKTTAESRGLSWGGAVRRASDRLGVIKYSTEKPGVLGAVWMWRLPNP